MHNFSLASRIPVLLIRTKRDYEQAQARMQLTECLYCCETSRDPLHDCYYYRQVSKLQSKLMRGAWGGAGACMCGCVCVCVCMCVCRSVIISDNASTCSVLHKHLYQLTPLCAHMPAEVLEQLHLKANTPKTPLWMSVKLPKVFPVYS